MTCNVLSEMLSLYSLTHAAAQYVYITDYMNDAHVECCNYTVIG